MRQTLLGIEEGTANDLAAVQSGVDMTGHFLEQAHADAKLLEFSGFRLGAEYHSRFLKQVEFQIGEMAKMHRLCQGGGRRSSAIGNPLRNCGSKSA